MMSRNGTGRTGRGRGGLAAVRASASWFLRLLGPTLMTWDTPALCPTASPLLPQFISLSFFLTSLLPSYIWRQS